MSAIIDGLGVFSIFGIIFIIISCFMWFLIPFWIISIKNSLKDIVSLLKNQNKK